MQKSMTARKNRVPNELQCVLFVIFSLFFQGRGMWRTDREGVESMFPSSVRFPIDNIEDKRLFFKSENRTATRKRDVFCFASSDAGQKAPRQSVLPQDVSSVRATKPETDNER
ncbi:MAG: hypothetical protein IKQ16_01155 [Lentisphaeria bacterium]|nr:hypothetical protein [Lentisphaeria bacterium]